jgi:hypothetical protein
VLCVATGTTVTWVVPPDVVATYAVAFSPNHSPFLHSLFLGDATHPFHDTANYQPGAGRCYVYSFVICNRYGSCQHGDPRVVITGP